jgi:hypothetical protein
LPAHHAALIAAKEGLDPGRLNTALTKIVRQALEISRPDHTDP